MSDEPGRRERPDRGGVPEREVGTVGGLMVQIARDLQEKHADVAAELSTTGGLPEDGGPAG